MMKTLHRLQIFNASFCELEDFPEFLRELYNITEVRLDGNKIQRTPSLWNLPCLQRISLKNNRGLRFDFDTLPDVVSLQRLELSSCRLTEIPPILLYIPILDTLDIENNAITRISEEMYRTIQRIPHVIISAPMLIEPPKEIYEADEATVEQYYQDLKVSQACKVGFYNVVLLGSTTAGKTSLIKSLVAEKSVLTTPENRTIALDEETWELMEDLHFHITDFSGHDVYELVYPIFLKEKKASVFIAVDLSTTTEENLEQNLFRWLHTVLSLSGDSSEIIAVGTKSDLCSGLPRKTNDLRTSVENWIRKNLDHADELLKSRELPEHKRYGIEHFEKMAVQGVRTVVTSSLSFEVFCNGGGFLSVKDAFSETGYPAFYR